MDLRSGGLWRFVQHDPDGREFAFHGVFHEVLAPERIIETFEFEGMPGHVYLGSLTLEDLGNKTKMISSSVFQSVEDRDGMVKSGMEQGVRESIDRLVELLAKLQAKES